MLKRMGSIHLEDSVLAEGRGRFRNGELEKKEHLQENVTPIRLGRQIVGTQEILGERNDLRGAGKC